jgi:hypothetical protein
MPENLPATRPRWRGAITVALLIFISVMVVWHVLARRWSGAAPPADAT